MVKRTTSTATARRTVRRTGLPPSEIDLYADEYKVAQARENEWKTKRESIRNVLLKEAEEQGDPDPKTGSFFLTALKWVVKKERRVTTVFDDEAAEKLLKRKGILAECSTTITVIDQDKVLLAAYDKKITEAEMKRLFVQDESWALRVIENK